MIGALTFSLLLLTGQKKTPAPEFVGTSKDWLQKPTSIKALHGKVVLVDFWDYTCVNCIRTFPYVKEWYKRYHNLGLEIVAIHTPEFKFEQDPAKVLAAAKRFGFTFSILNDPKEINWNDYRVSAWPTKLILDPDGVPIYVHVGESGYFFTEQAIQKQILRIHPNAKLPAPMDPVHDTDQAGAVCHPCTAEIYMGAKGIDNGVPWTAAAVGKPAMFTFPPTLEPGTVYPSGKWTPTKDYLAPAGPGSNLRLSYGAKEVNVVVVPSAGPVKVEVLQDGAPLAPKDLGSDVHLVNGHATFTASAPRMYSIIKNNVWGKRVLELRVQNRGLRFYTFSFSTDCMFLPPNKKDRHYRR